MIKHLSIVIKRGIIKYIWLIGLSILCLRAFSNTVFVGINGNDSYPGTIEEPFATISHAVSVINEGDTIYVLSGRYILTSTIQISSSVSGSPGNLCHLFAYPGDTVIIDFYPQAFGNRGINLRADYWFLKNLTVCNAGDNGLYIQGNHNRIEQCVFYGNDDTGLQISGGGAYNMVVNCDAFNNVDPDHEDADGFAAKLDIGPGNEFHSCRSWNNSDDGWDLYAADDSVVIANCWTFRNGYLPNESLSTGNGNGFKLGGNDVPGNHLVKNCIAFNNRKHGFHQNSNTGDITIYNSLGWGNGERNYNFLHDTAGPNILVNNISFDGGSSDRFINCNDTTNSWQSIPADSDDFLTLLLKMAKDARMPDGSLPENTFARLAIGSNLIDAGTDLGFTYTGIAPDLGPFETLTPDADYSLTTSVNGEGGIWLSPPGGTYATDQEVILIAWHADNYLFDTWSGDVSGTDDTVNVIMDSDKLVTANFILENDMNNDSIRIEAEDMILSDYIFERLTGASNGKTVRPTTTSFGSGTTTFIGQESYYRIVVRYLDNANGAATYQFSVNNNIIKTWEGNIATITSEFVEKTIINVTLTEGDVVEIESKPGGLEFGRIDCIDLIKNEYIEPGLIITENTRNFNPNITIYPNPFNDLLLIKFALEKTSSLKLDILSIDGKLISTLIEGKYLLGSYKLEYITGNLKPGIYLIRFITQESTSINNVVK